MQIVVPMSGIGKRFIEAGYDKPKPLIEVNGFPIIKYVIDLFPKEVDFLFICNEDHLNTTDMEQVLKKLKPTGKIVSIKPHKLGPVYAVLQSEEFIKDEEPIIVNYCDFYMLWDYRQFKDTVLSNEYAGAIPSYQGFHPHLLGPNKYASCNVDKEKNLIEIREKFSFTKEKMDCPQSVGTYYFRSGKILKHYFRELIEKKLSFNDEYYVSLVYNLLVQEGHKVWVSPVEKFFQWGTPDDLVEYSFWSDYFRDLGDE